MTFFSFFFAQQKRKRVVNDKVCAACLVVFSQQCLALAKKDDFRLNLKKKQTFVDFPSEDSPG